MVERTLAEIEESLEEK